jgi:RND family efflux transporter MFP subunit
MMLLVAMLIVGAAGCNRKAPPAAAKKTAGGSTQVDVVEVTSRDIQRQVDLPGASVLGFQTADLIAKIEGYVKTVHVDIGQQVKHGDALAELDVPEMAFEIAERETLVRQAEADLYSSQAEVERAKAQLEADRALKHLREAEHRRIENLVDSGALHRQKLDEAQFAFETAVATIAKSKADLAATEAHVQSARARIEVAQAVLAKSETMLQYATIRAPFDGVITRRLVDRGAFVRPASSDSTVAPLFTIVEVDKLRVVVSVPMIESTRITVGQKAVFKNIGGLPDRVVEGEISRCAVALEPGSRMMRAEMDLANPADPKTGHRVFKPGMFGSVSLIVQSQPNTPSVPASALGSDADGHYVMVVESGRCRRHPVQVVFNDAVTAGITGVTPGTLVVAKDITRLTNDQPVTIRQ